MSCLAGSAHLPLTAKCTPQSGTVELSLTDKCAPPSGTVEQLYAAEGTAVLMTLSTSLLYTLYMYVTTDITSL